MFLFLLAMSQLLFHYVPSFRIVKKVYLNNLIRSLIILFSVRNISFSLFSCFRLEYRFIFPRSSVVCYSNLIRIFCTFINSKSKWGETERLHLKIEQINSKLSIISGRNGNLVEFIYSLQPQINSLGIHTVRCLSSGRIWFEVSKCWSLVCEWFQSARRLCKVVHLKLYNFNEKPDEGKRFDFTEISFSPDDKMCQSRLLIQLIWFWKSGTL